MVVLWQLALPVLPMEMNLAAPWNGKAGTGQESMALISASLFEKTDHPPQWPWQEPVLTLCYCTHRAMQGEKEKEIYSFLVCSPEICSESEFHGVTALGVAWKVLWMNPF